MIYLQIFGVVIFYAVLLCIAAYVLSWILHLLTRKLDGRKLFPAHSKTQKIPFKHILGDHYVWLLLTVAITVFFGETNIKPYIYARVSYLLIRVCIKVITILAYLFLAILFACWGLDAGENTYVYGYGFFRSIAYQIGDLVKYLYRERISKYNTVLNLKISREDTVRFRKQQRLLFKFKRRFRRYDQILHWSNKSCDSWSRRLSKD